MRVKEVRVRRKDGMKVKKRKLTQKENEWDKKIS